MTDRIITHTEEGGACDILGMFTPSVVGFGHNLGTPWVLPLADGVNNYPTNEGDFLMSRCNNGGCSRAVYRGKYCFRCWAGVKWTSIVQRVQNKTGHCRTYEGIPIGFTREELIDWVLTNPPPMTMMQPSIDRIEPLLGYVPGNIRWLEFRKNCSGMQRDVPEGFLICHKCLTQKPIETFHIFPGGKQSYKCKSCCPRRYPRENTAA